ncbi:helix-turn-helix domain-containing protein [Flavilitoribacter nigricans]|nr:helix-turn-helix domain-containing protein [Flavilitoribacter nigricans]
MMNTIVWAAIIQGLLLGIVYSSSKKYNAFANRLLGAFLFTLVAEALTIFLPFESIGGYPLTGYFALPEVKLFFPLLFVHFVLEKVGQSGHYRPFLRIHYYLAFAVAGLTAVNLLVFFFTGSPLRTFTGSRLLTVIFMSQQVYAFGLSIVALLISIRATRHYRERVKNEYSDFTMLEINWLWQFIFIIIPIILLWGGELIRIALGGEGGESDLVMINWGLLVIFIYFVSYKAFRHQNLFEGSDAGTTPAPDTAVKSEEENDDYDRWGERLKQNMESEKHYLDHDLTIHELARKLSISPRLISTCINRYFGCNFSEWINNYRVDEALRRLEDPENAHLSIEGIGLDSGFKSRSAMYTAFKKKTGRTPGHFRQVEVS